MSSVDKEYYEYLDKLDKEELITKVVNLESQNNELSNENYELGRENEQLKSGELISPEVAKQSFEMRDKTFKKLETRIEELEDAIKVKDMLIEQLENQNDRLIVQRDTQEQQLANYKGALKLACERLSREDVFKEQTKEDYYLNQSKKEMEEQK